MTKFSSLDRTPPWNWLLSTKTWHELRVLKYARDVYGKLNGSLDKPSMHKVNRSLGWWLKGIALLFCTVVCQKAGVRHGWHLCPSSLPWGSGIFAPELLRAGRVQEAKALEKQLQIMLGGRWLRVEVQGMRYIRFRFKVKHGSDHFGFRVPSLVP